MKFFRKTNTESCKNVNMSIRKYINNNFSFTSAVIEFIDTLHYQPISSLDDIVNMLNLIFEDETTMKISEIENVIHSMGDEGQWMSKIANFTKLANYHPLFDFGSLFLNDLVENNDEYFKEFLFVFYDTIVGVNGDLPSGISYTRWQDKLRDRENKFKFEYDRVKFAVSSITEPHVFKGYTMAFTKLNDDILTIINTNGIKYLELLSKIITNQSGKCVDYATDYKNVIRSIQDEFWCKSITKFVLKNNKLEYNRNRKISFDEMYFASSENGSIRIRINDESKYISFNEILYVLTSLTENPFVEHASPNVLYTAAVYIYFMREAENVIKDLIFE